MSLEGPVFPSTFDWQQVRATLEDWFYRVNEFFLAQPIRNGFQRLDDTGQVDNQTLITKWSTTGPATAGLMDGYDTQVKIVVLLVPGGAAVLTPDNFGNGATITFNNAGDSVQLQFLDGEWWVIALNGAVVA